MENLYNSSHKCTNQQYRDAYDSIRWDRVKQTHVPCPKCRCKEVRLVEDEIFADLDRIRCSDCNALRGYAVIED